MSPFVTYLLAANVVAFLAYTVDFFLCGLFPKLVPIPNSRRRRGHAAGAVRVLRQASRPSDQQGQRGLVVPRLCLPDRMGRNHDCRNRPDAREPQRSPRLLELDRTQGTGHIPGGD